MPSGGIWPSSIDFHIGLAPGFPGFRAGPLLPPFIRSATVRMSSPPRFDSPPWQLTHFAWNTGSTFAANVGAERGVGVGGGLVLPGRNADGVGDFGGGAAGEEVFGCG